jgi:aminopeptidase N
MEGTVAHETAHQWFGGHVTQVDWPELWLSEGFATYFGHLFFEHADGVDVFRARMEESRQSYLDSDLTGQAVIDRGETNLFEHLNANNYPKGGWILHMLRALVGDETFFAGIRHYYESFAGGNASSNDFRGAMEAVYGQDLDWFFDQWLERPGYPMLSIASEWDTATGEAVVTITQAQPDAWPAFRFPLEVESVRDGRENPDLPASAFRSSGGRAARSGRLAVAPIGRQVGISPTRSSKESPPAPLSLPDTHEKPGSLSLFVGQ